MLGTIEAAITVSEKIDSKEQRTSTARQGTMRIFVAVKRLLRERRGHVNKSIWCTIFS
jgi:3,4-dihydroxy-2-butanone 4-phosphate synthase